VLSDVELGSQAVSGDVGALAALLERHRPALYATAVGLLGNRADAHDAVQDTFVIALLRLGDLRDPGAAGAWLRTVLRNVCLARIRQHRETPSDGVGVVFDPAPGPEHAFEQHALRDWVWRAMDELSPDERLTLMLRHFSRCASYEAIALITATPVGTVRSRLHRARTRLVRALSATTAGTPLDQVSAEAPRRAQWEGFYRDLHERPVPATYLDLFAPDVDVRDPAGHWSGIQAWSAEERDAIDVGVRARIVGVLASRDVTVLEIDFSNPPEWPDHCPPHATFVHRLSDRRSSQLRIHYPGEHPESQHDRP